MSEFVNEPVNDNLNINLSIFTIAEYVAEQDIDNLVDSNNLELLKEQIQRIINRCPWYFKISKNYDYTLNNIRFYSNFLAHVFDNNIKTYEINYNVKQKQINELFIGILKPDDYNKNTQMLTYDNIDYIGIGILQIYDDDTILLKTYNTYETM
jgi:hypothetical protein